MGSTTNTAAHAVLAWATTKYGAALGAVPHSVVVRGAVAAGAVPGYAPHIAPTPRPPTGTPSNHPGARMHSLGRSYRQLYRAQGMGPRANGHGTAASQAQAAKVPTAGLAKACKVATTKAAKAQAQAAKAAKVQAANAPASTPASK